MHVATQEFPRIWISNSAPSNWKEKLETLLDQGQRFVLLTRELPGAEDSSDKEEFSQWIKDNQITLERLPDPSLTRSDWTCKSGWKRLLLATVNVRVYRLFASSVSPTCD